MRFSYRYKLFFLLLAFTTITSVSTAQFNLKVGYTGGYLADGGVQEQIFDLYNADKPFLDDQLGAMRVQHGLEFGVRYRFGLAALETGVSFFNSNTEANGIDASESLVTQKYSLSNREIYIGLESFVGKRFSYGATLARRRFAFSRDLPNIKQDLTVMEETVWASRFYVGYYFDGTKSRLAIKPFVQMPWSDNNFQSLRDDFDPPPSSSSNFSQRVLIYGISVMFYNGRQ